jgi:hypothetical protein
VGQVSLEARAKVQAEVWALALVLARALVLDLAPQQTWSLVAKRIQGPWVIHHML